MAETKVPALPDPTTVKDPQLRRTIAAIKEALDIRLGRRGDGLDRAVTLRELYENGVVTVTGKGVVLNLSNEFSLNTPRIPMTAPPAPQNFTAQGAFTHVLLQWTIPRYPYHALTEIWRAEVDDLSLAELVGTSSSEVYSDPVDTAKSYYYWARFKSQADVVGAYNATAGTAASTSVPAAEVLDALQGSITETQLSTDLNTRLSNTDQTLIEQSQSITGLSASLTVKIDANGRVAGYGLASETNEAGETTSSFIVSADQFGIFHPGATQTLVFGIENGKTVMDGAYMKDASIDNAKIADAAIDSAKIADAAITSAKIGDAQVTSAKIASLDAGKIVAGSVWVSGIVQSAGYNGTTGFKLDANAAGTAVAPTIQGAYIKGGTIDGATLTGGVLEVTDVKVRAVGYPDNYGPLALHYTNSLYTSSTSAALESVLFTARSVSSGYDAYRMCSDAQKFSVTAYSANAALTNIDHYVRIYVSYDGGPWVTLVTRIGRPFAAATATLTVDGLESVRFRAYTWDGNGSKTLSLEVRSENGSA